MVPQLEMPSNRVPQLNLGKLSSDKKIAVVKVLSSYCRYNTECLRT